MDATFHGGSNDIIGGRGRLRRPEKSPIYILQLWQLPTSMASLFSSPARNLSPVTIFSKIRGDIHELMFITGVNDTGEKLFSGVNDTGEIYRNLSPVTRTRTPWRWRKLKGINRRYLRPPKSATAADGIIGTAMKSCIHKHPTHLDQRPEATKTK